MTATYGAVKENTTLTTQPRGPSRIARKNVTDQRLTGKPKILSITAWALIFITGGIDYQETC
jgi:hypothetical protein